MTLLNGTPWLATVQCDASLDEVRAWIDNGIESGVLAAERVEQTDTDVVLDVDGGVVNFIGNYRKEE